eukprot:SAG31_NODE_28037_length_416_cov_0.905363_1_plen_27_part_01
MDMVHEQPSHVNSAKNTSEPSSPKETL